MFHTFEQINAVLEKGNFTRIYNPLEDLLLEAAPHEYLRFWRYLWRKTIGWNKIGDHLSLRDIARAAKINPTDASRIAYFFHTTQLIHYTPGDKTHSNVCPATCEPGCRLSTSYFRILPIGFLPEDHLRQLFETLEQVQFWERKERAKFRDFRFTANEFNIKLQEAWKMLGGQVSA